MTTKFSGSARLLLALSLITFAAWFGYRHSSPWIIPILGVMFTPLYITGKWQQWKLTWQHGGLPVVVKALISTVPVQMILAGMFYLIGLGVGTLTTTNSVSTGVTQDELLLVAGFFFLSLILSGLIIFAEAKAETGLGWQFNSTAESSSSDDIDEDLRIDPTPITEDRFFWSRHFSCIDYSEQALANQRNHDGSKPVRAPLGASLTAIKATEARLGFVLPARLRALYQRQDGGSLPAYWVPRVERPRASFDDWIDAFANDYNDLKPLPQLQSLYAIYMEYFDPDYDDIEVQQSWYPGSEKTIVLAQRYSYGTLLDYNNSADPEVVIFDYELAPGEQVRARFKNFEAFFNALRAEVREPRSNSLIVDGAPNLELPDQFWDVGNRTQTGISEADWQTAEQRLGRVLPLAIKPLLAALDGGQPVYQAHLTLGTDANGEPRSPFPSRYGLGVIQPLSRWVSLAELSARLNFIDGHSPWASVVEEGDKLIVICASFESAVLLDYRAAATPEVVFASELSDPEGWVNLGSMDVFLSGLRRVANAGRPVQGFISDARLSARAASAATFWSASNTNSPAAAHALTELEERFDIELPEQLRELVQVKDGGPVRFQYLPPEWPNEYGYVNPHPEESTWVSLFPNGINPIAQWCWLREWRDQQQLAVSQDIYELMPTMASEIDIVEKLIVIGVDRSSDGCLLTLLDMSTASFKNMSDLLLVQYDQPADSFKIVLQPKSLTHYTHGVLAMVRAHK